jgi:hypothetical protein
MKCFVKKHTLVNNLPQIFMRHFPCIIFFISFRFDIVTKLRWVGHEARTGEIIKEKKILEQNEK